MAKEGRKTNSNRRTAHGLEKARKRRIKFFLLIIVLIGILVFVNLKTVIRTSDEAKNKSSDMDSLKNLKEKTILKSENKEDWINNIKIYARQNNDAKFILDNINELDDHMIRLASDRPDSLGFVAKFINPSRVNRFDYNRSGYNKVVTNNKNIPYYVQWDDDWGYKEYGEGIIGYTGCGPTSMAMVVSGLTGDSKITPNEIASLSTEKGYVNGEGSSWDLYPYIAEKYNLVLKTLSPSKENIENNLKAEKVIVVSVGPGDFTQNGHVMVITGLDKSGNIVIHDPNSVDNTKKTWTYEQLEPQIKALWAVGTKE